jgi:chromate reductase, NAD(P)H dehydrogenase (quinone)
LRLLTIAGSLRPDSYNRMLLRNAEDHVPDGVELEHWDRLAEVPPFHGLRTDTGDAPEAVDHLRRSLDEADAVLIATPEYNGSIPGVLKNALDWASTPFPDNALRGKPVAVIGASTGGYGAMWAQADLRRVLGISGARMVGAEMALARAQDAFDEEGRLAPHHRGRLEAVVNELVGAAQPIAA